jgi:hypothetical protein
MMTFINPFLGLLVVLVLRKAPDGMESSEESVCGCRILEK